MPKYKIKKSYLDLKEDENFCTHRSPAKHSRLITGEVVEIDSVPDVIKPHLQEVKEKTSKKGDK
tara:strand:+ start:607 stop:798 length:192 start_codon:yes stop_codon:yes gene_type:complete